jgi:Ca2+-binding EF-hand superfamily protein
MSSVRLKQRLQAALKLKGYGVLSLVNAFREIDLNGDGVLSWVELSAALSKSGLNPSPQVVRALFVELDTDGSNTISYDEFVASMRSDLSPKRVSIIKRVFESVDSDGDGVISMVDIGNALNPKNHPDVKAGRITVPTFLKLFFDSFNNVSQTGLITLDQFLEYYANMAAFDDDKSFENTMLAMWNVKSNSSNKGFKSLQDIANKKSEDPRVDIPGLAQLREQLVSRGARGIIGLQRSFKSIDEDGSGALNLFEFKKALRQMNIVLSDIQQNNLFTYFDKDRNGSISIEEFLQGLRGPLSAARRSLVNLAFDTLDRAGKGLVTPEDIVGVYDASKHPDVVSGQRSAADVLREFLDTFDVGGIVDGKVTRQEFENYYSNLSAGIEDDQYFEFMIRRAWNLGNGDVEAAKAASLPVRAQGDNSGVIQRFSPRADSGAPQKDVTPAASSAQSKDVSIAVAGPNAIDPASANRVDNLINPSVMANPGVGYILNLLKTEMKNRGGTGFISLQRKFRIMDEDNNGSISMVEFKKALNEMRVGLDESQMRKLFDYFDTDHSGSIDFEEFIQGFRDPLNERRKRLVQTAFTKLDKEGNGIIDAQEIASVYDASRHPEVIAGRQTPDQVLRKFLDTFDVGGEVDGKVTQQEFENYYANLGASIDNDDYFELLIRNSWHINGGVAHSAHSTNRHVLITRADGSQHVDEIKDDLGIRPDDKIGMMARLRKQGVFASHISLTDSVEDHKRASKKTSLSAVMNKEGNTSGKQQAAPNARPQKQQLSQDELIAQMGPRASDTGNAAKPVVAGITTANTVVKDVSYYRSGVVSPGLQLIIQKLKTELKSRGIHGFIGLQRKFRIMDEDGNKSLDLGEFKKGLKEMGLDLTDADVRMLFDYFDRDHSGSIDFEEFIRGVRDPLSPRRQSLVKLAFIRLDRDGNGVIDAEDIAKIYDPSKHPDVLSGRSTPAAVLRDFLDTFDVGGEVDGKVTQQEFENYYSNVGASIDNDDYFELMIRNSWHISGGVSPAANSSSRRVLVTRSDGSQSVEEIQDDSDMHAGDNIAMMAKLRKQGVFASHLSTTGLVVQLEDGPSRHKRFVSNLGKSTAAAGVLPGTKYELNSGTEAPRAAVAVPPAPPSAGLLVIISKLKGELGKRGARGYIGLQRKFRLMDDDGSGTLDLGEFKKAMKEMNMGLSEPELRFLFDHFDTNHNGSIDFEEFIQGVRDKLNDRRTRLVELAFSRLDKDGKGSIDVQHIATMYDASKHPEVIAGRLTADQVFREFLDTFDVGGEIDGKVTLQEFINYYTNLGASIDNDDYFELMVRNSWNLSGSDSHTANSASRRVLVTKADGSQSVEEIKNDLGLKANDKAGMMARLKAQGVDPAKISLYDGMDSTKDEPVNPNALKPNLNKSQAFTSQKTAEVRNIGLGSSKKRIGQRSSSAATADSTATYGLQLVIQKLKNELRSRGGYGFISLHRKFRSMDDNGNKSLDLGEFKKGMKEMNMGLSDPELRMVFDYFDTDQSGSIDLEEFIQGIRDPLNDRRLALVRTAFGILDSDKSGVVECSDIIEKYDATKHPDVIAKRKTPQQILTEFLNTFEVGGTVDGKVTRQEFENYYTNLGASIDNDDYFELMIRNAWQINGGQGQAANSNNCRVLVTKADSSQSSLDGYDDTRPSTAPASTTRIGRFSGVGPSHRSKIVLGDDTSHLANNNENAHPNYAPAKKSVGIQGAKVRLII